MQLSQGRPNITHADFTNFVSREYPKSNEQIKIDLIKALAEGPSDVQGLLERDAGYRHGQALGQAQFSDFLQRSLFLNRNNADYLGVAYQIPGMGMGGSVNVQQFLNDY